MSAELAARIFLNWAFDEGLTSLESRPIAVAPPVPHPLAAVSVEAKTYLRDRMVQGVAANEEDEEIIVFLRKVAPKSKKLLERLPDSVGDIAISYRQGVTQPIDPNAPIPFGGPPYALHMVGQTAHYTCGSSISVGNYREAGTLGALVRDATGKLYGLSNSHVVASCNQAAARTPIVAPGVCDVTAANHPPFTIGFFERGLPVVSGSPDTIAWQDNSDVALFEVRHPDDVSSMQQSFYDTPANAAELKAGMAVQKVGRTTGLSNGVVRGEMVGYFGVPYSAAVYDFRGIVYQQSVFVVDGIGKAFSEGGDSGSLVIHTTPQGDNVAVGIVFAGMQNSAAPGGISSLILPIAPILVRLGVQLVSGHNV